MMKQQDAQGNYPTIKDFVLQEAYEKAFEINVIGLKDFEKERNHLLEQKQELVHDELQKKNKEQLAAARIHKSSLINGSRMKKMQARHENLLQIIKATEAHLSTKLVTNRSEYSDLLKQLIVEGLIKMLEPVVRVRCLARDREYVKSVLEEAKAEFRNLLSLQGIDESVGKVDLSLDDQELEERILGQEEEHHAKISKSQRCFGGVVMTNADGLIVCNNTLDSRVELAYQQMLPVIRKKLFN